MAERSEEYESRQVRRAVERAKYKKYRDGGDGCILWAEENVCVSIFVEGSDIPVWTPIKDLSREPNPVTGRSYWSMWQEQCEVLRAALRMENGRFVHRLIVFCWPRGEGKSFIADLIQMWKFFCWPKQNIVLCSNSKEQSTFLQYEEIRAHIEHSPNLLRFVGKKNIQEKEIRIKDKAGHIVSRIQSISSFSGIVSNITGYAYSEFFENKLPAFFEKVDGSIRNVPNALGVIDSTVSSKEHVLYHLYQASVKKEDPLLFFNYRSSKNGDYRDFWHPHNTQAQLNSYKIKFPMGGFARYFQNLWSAGAEKVFSQEDVDAVNYIGADGSANCHKQVIELIRRKHEIIDQDQGFKQEGVDIYGRSNAIQMIEKKLWSVSDIYSLKTGNGISTIADVESLDRLSEIYDTDWAIIGGIDRADPMKKRTAARSIFTVVAKGLPGSRSNPNIGMGDDIKSDDDSDDSRGRRKKNQKIKPELAMPTLSYIYFLLYLVDIQDHSSEAFKTHILIAHDEFDGIDVIGSERYNVVDMVSWGEPFGIDFQLVHSYYNMQLAMFSYFFTLVNTGRFKGPDTGVVGSKMDDILKEELAYFDHDSDKKWFGSPEKNLKTGVQDDWIFCCCQWDIWRPAFECG